MFNPYKGLVYDHRKDPDFKNNPVASATLQKVHQFISDPNHSDATQLCVYEIAHYTLSHQVLHLGRALTDYFLNSGFDSVTLGDIKNLALPFRLFELCFEDKTYFPGTKEQIPSCLVSVFPDDSTISALEKTYLAFAEQVIAELQVVWVKRPPSADSIVQFLLEIPRRFDDYILIWVPLQRPELDDWSIQVFVFPLEDFKDVTFKGFDEPATDPDGNLVQSAADMNVRARVLFHLVTSTICFLNTKECDIQKFKMVHRPQFRAMSPTGHILGESIPPYEIGAHLRRGHFRVYKDDKYAKNLDGTFKVGWVRPALVNPKGSPAVPDAKILELT
jgi:hypothetical protein